MASGSGFGGGSKKKPKSNAGPFRGRDNTITPGMEHYYKTGTTDSIAEQTKNAGGGNLFKTIGKSLFDSVAGGGSSGGGGGGGSGGGGGGGYSGGYQYGSGRSYSPRTARGNTPAAAQSRVQTYTRHGNFRGPRLHSPGFTATPPGGPGTPVPTVPPGPGTPGVPGVPGTPGVPGVPTVPPVVGPGGTPLPVGSPVNSGIYTQPGAGMIVEDPTILLSDFVESKFGQNSDGIYRLLEGNAADAPALHALMQGGAGALGEKSDFVDFTSDYFGKMTTPGQYIDHRELLGNLFDSGQGTALRNMTSGGTPQENVDTTLGLTRALMNNTMTPAVAAALSRELDRRSKEYLAATARGGSGDFLAFLRADPTIANLLGAAA